MIEMQSIHRIYRTEHVETHALSEFSLKIESGEFISVMGPSGSGKTTFLNIAGLLDTFDQGTYLLDGEDVSDRQEIVSFLRAFSSARYQPFDETEGPSGKLPHIVQ